MSEERKAAERMLLRLLGVAAAFAVVRSSDHRLSGKN